MKNDAGTSGGVGIVRAIRQCNRRERFSVDNQEPTEMLIYSTTRGWRLNYQPAGAGY